MSCPSVDQAKQIVDRVGTLLDEWDGARYALAVKCEGGDWCFLSNASPFHKMIVARGLLAEAIETCQEDPDPEIDS